MSRGRPDPMARLRRARSSAAGIYGDEPPRAIPARAEVRTERPEWVIIPMAVKHYCAEHADPPYMPPVVVAWRGGEKLCHIIAGRVDASMGLRAADVARRALGADEVTLAVDTSFVSTKGVTREEYRRRYPPGSMQELWESNPQLAEETLTESISVWRATTGGLIENASLCYDWKGAGGKLRWIDHPGAGHDGEPVSLGGTIPEALMRIMAAPWMGESPDVVEPARQMLGTERGWYIMAATAMRQLEREGFHVEDLVTGTGPGRDPIRKGGGD